MDQKQTAALYEKGHNAWADWADGQLAKREDLVRSGSWSQSRDPKKWNPPTSTWHSSASVDFSQTQFVASVDFHDLEFPGTANFDNTIFDEPADFGGCTFHGPAFFLGVRFNSYVIFRLAQFLMMASFEGSHFEGRADVEGARFDDVMSFDGTYFKGRTNFMRMVVGGVASFSNVRFHNLVRFDQTQFGSVAFFQNVVFPEDASFAAADFRKLNANSFINAGLQHIDLSTTIGLTQEVIENANGNLATKLPRDLHHPQHWLEENEARDPAIAGAPGTPNQGATRSPQVKSRLRVTPPADFEWKDGKLHPEIVPLPPEKRGVALERKVNLAARDLHLKAVTKLAADLLAGLAEYRDLNRQAFVKDLSGPLRSIARETEKPGELVIASYLRAKLSVLKVSSDSAEAEALDGVDRIELQQFLEEGAELLKFFPELLEIYGTDGARLIPAKLAEQADEYADRVRELVESDEGEEIFSKAAVDVVRTQHEFDAVRKRDLSAAPEDRVAYQQEKMSLFGSLIGAIHDAMANAPPAVHALGSYASIMAVVVELWNVVRPFLSSLR